MMPLPLWFSLLVLGWLAIVAWMDWRTRHVYHIAWLTLPLLTLLIVRLITGDLSAVWVTAWTVLTSERDVLFSDAMRRRWVQLTPGALMLGLWYQPENWVVLMLLVSAWALWEWKLWGGADALAMITLLLSWGWVWAAVFLAVQVAALIIVRLKPGEMWKIHHIPALPLMLASAVIFCCWGR